MFFPRSLSSLNEPVSGSLCESFLGVPVSLNVLPCL